MSKIIFTICVLIATSTVCLLMHGFIRGNHHITKEHHQQSHDTKVTPSELTNLIANMTRTIAAIETGTKRLEEELQRMRHTTRQLLSKYRKDAVWTAIHKCVFFCGCNKQNYIPRTTGNGANTNFPQNTKPTPSQRKTKKKIAMKPSRNVRLTSDVSETAYLISDSCDGRNKLANFFLIRIVGKWSPNWVHSACRPLLAYYTCPG
jgi:hypothetical protein